MNYKLKENESPSGQLAPVYRPNSGAAQASTRWLWVIILCVAIIGCGTESAPEITVSAAANLIPAFEEIGRRFEAETGIQVIFNFGSSGQLAQQIAQGAPVDVFASANADYVLDLAQAGHLQPASARVYAIGRLVIWGREPAQVPDTLAGLAAPEVERISLANPDHAPYGIVAKAVLVEQDLWPRLQAKFIIGADVRQALTLAETGDVTVALVPLSLVYQLQHGAYTLIPHQQHVPIEQMIAITAGNAHPQAAQQFIDFVLSTQGQMILQQFGYEPPKP